MPILWRRLGLAAALLSIGCVVAAQPPAATRPPTPVTANFTGAVQRLDAADVSTVRFQYAAGARSYWHAHGGDQLLWLESGRGRAQVKGQAMRELTPDNPVVLPAGVPHWHGAAPDEGLTQIAVNIGAATWMAPVTDEEYRGR